MERPGEEREQSELKSYDISKNNVVIMDDGARLNAMMKMAAKSLTNRRFYKIDVTEFKIIDVIGQDELNIPKDLLMNTSPEALIPNKIAVELCKQVIKNVYENGKPKTLTLPFTIGNRTFKETIHFKRGNRHDDHNTIIAYVN